MTTALVIGGTSGVGLVVVRQLAAEATQSTSPDETQSGSTGQPQASTETSTGTFSTPATRRRPPRSR
jgi:NAD(P)-dependent dehydrogenase (short-subunit alcohol dehydrogenase family)